MAQLTRHKRFQRSFALSEGDVRLPAKLARALVDLSDSGRLLQTVGPATEKARSEKGPVDET